MCEGMDLFSSEQGMEIVFYAGTLCPGESLIGGDRSVLFHIKHDKYLKLEIDAPADSSVVATCARLPHPPARCVTCPRCGVKGRTAY
eukprot:8095356-Pyramimonas_sp.AAC.2